MKTSKFICTILGIIQLSTALLLIVGMHTLLGVFTSALPEEATGIEFQFTDPVIIPLTLTPANTGFLEAKMDVGISIVVDGVEVASDLNTVIIPPGGMVPVELELSIALEEAQQYFQEGADFQWKTDIKVATLYDLISFGNSLIIEGDIE